MAEKETVIGADTEIIGEVRGDASLLVRGRVQGKINIGQVLTVADGAIVQADVEGKSVEIAGVLVGNITASEHVRLSPKSKVVGNISAPRVAIEAGAAYRGRLEMGEIDLAKRAHGKASTSASHSQARSVPRLAAPPRAASASIAAPRVISVPSRPVEAKASAPAWATKKTRRR